MGENGSIVEYIVLAFSSMFEENMIDSKPKWIAFECINSLEKIT